MANDKFDDIFGHSKAGSRQYRIRNCLIIVGILLALGSAGSYIAGLERTAGICFYGLFVVWGAFELMRGMRMILRVLTSWVPGLTVLSARYESWLDEEITHR